MTDFDTREMPNDVEAEQAVLGSMLLSAAAVETCAAALVGGDFYRQAHGILFDACLAVRRAGVGVDPITVKGYLDEHGLTGTAGGPPYVHTLMAAAPAPANAAHYAGIVRGTAIRRRLIEAGTRVRQLGWSGDGDSAHGLTEHAVRELEAVRDYGASDSVATPTIGEFLAVPDEEYDWIVPGLLERGDRLVLTGMEGAGKSTLFRQFAVMIAAGLHPFRGTPIEPRRVLIVDVENGVAQVRRKIRPLVTQAGLLGHPVDDRNLWLEVRPEGLDLARDRDVSWLLRRVALIQPDVCTIGPLYRLAPRALNSDDEAAPILSVLNMIRARGAALLLEAHAGHALGVGGRRDLRPRGSSALLGWSEFGYGIRPAEDADAKKRRKVDFVAWRGDRDEREWPEQLEAGGAWPWAEAIPGYASTQHTPHLRAVPESD